MNTNIEAVTNLEDDLERAQCNLSLLSRWASAEVHANRGCTNIEEEHKAWRAASWLLIDAVETLKKVSV